MTTYQAKYRDNNDAINIIDLSAKTERGAKAQATHHAPAMRHITLLRDGHPVATRTFWRNPNGVFSLDPWA